MPGHDCSGLHWKSVGEGCGQVMLHSDVKASETDLMPQIIGCTEAREVALNLSVRAGRPTLPRGSDTPDQYPSVHRTRAVTFSHMPS